MKRLLLFSMAVLSLCATQAQLLTWTPNFPIDDNSTISITMDATKGNQGLLNYNPDDVYVHVGLNTSTSSGPGDWKYVKFTWATTNPAAKAVSLGGNKWRFDITGGLRSFFNVTNAGETINKINILFRSGNGNQKQANSDNTDMYVPVYASGVQVRLTQPIREPRFIPWVEPITAQVGSNISIAAVSSIASSMELKFNGTTVQTASAATSISGSGNIAAAGTQTIVALATSGATTKADTIQFFVQPSTVNIAPLPAGVRDGINYEADATAVTLVLFAPGKNRVSVIGDFNNYTETLASQMNKTPDGKRWWIRLTGLTAGQEVGYQYLVDGNLRVGDPYCEKVLTTLDQFITSSTYPNLKPYPNGLTTGEVGIFQTNKPSFTWTVNNFARPDKRNLIIYELLVRDFVATRSWSTLRDTLNYLKNLGVNAIEVMPFNEFAGNDSWGYNPTYYCAPDKAYGTETALKQFIDECHKKGMAVIMDMVMNHSMDESPYVRLWSDGTGRPTAANPFYNIYDKHAFSVGRDMNHESQDTKDYVDRVIEFWLNNYKIDGFRWDLSKGFTQTQTCDAVGQNCNVGSWGNYDASRVAIWQRIYNKMQSTSANSYCILEHLGIDQEEADLAGRGMLLWGKMTDEYNQNTLGFNSNNDLSRTLFYTRGFASPHLIGYMESHDEERIMYKNLNFGSQSNTAHNVRDLNVGLKRTEAAHAFLSMMPGPKMLWQFGEYGYDFSINYCPNGTISNNCRTDAKPIRWDYLQNANRVALRNAYAKMHRLRIFNNYFNTWIAGQANITTNLGGQFKWFSVNSDSLKILVVGNFDVFAQNANVTFPSSGTYYDYMGTGTFAATGTPQNFALQPGEYKIYTSRDANAQIITPIGNINNPTIEFKVSISPTPVAGVATITYDLPLNADVSISLLSSTGQQLGNIFKGYRTRGRQQLSFSKVGNMPTGMYLLQFIVNGKVKTHRFIVE
jgi:1,4-alpha-glucan branching enzyme